MADYIIKEKTLADIADAIRAKTGSTESMTAGQMPEDRDGISDAEFRRLVEEAL